MIRVSGDDATVTVAAQAVQAALGGVEPQVAVVLGSGLGGLADRVERPVRIDYAQVPGFHLPKVEGHRGELVAGTLAGMPVILQGGRFHMYEGHSAADAALPVRVFATLGVKLLIVTNAAGGIRRSFASGTMMLIKDHLNLTGRSPLEGAVLQGETRFPDMSVAYDLDLRRLAQRVGEELGHTVEEGIYAGLLGPSYETPAEIRMLERLGADAVGMSTVAEVIAARARGMRVLGISLISNPAAGISLAPLDHAEVMAAAKEAGGRLGDLVTGVIGRLGAP